MSYKVKHLLGLLLALFLVLGMLFGLRSCGNKINLPNFGEMRQVINKDVENVNNIIANLPEVANVKLDDLGAVSAARTAYDALKDADKEKVVGLDKLVSLENALNELQATPTESEGLVALKDLLSSIKDFEKPLLFEKFDEAKRGYDALTDEEKAQIDLTDLQALETELKKDGDFLNFVLNKIELPKDLDIFNKLKLDIDALSDEEKAKIDMDLLDKLNASLEEPEVVEESAAKKVEDMISAIKTPITLDSEDELNKVKAAYDALSDADKANYQKTTGYVNINDASDLITREAYNGLPAVGKGSYTQQQGYLDKNGKAINEREYDKLSDADKAACTSATIYSAFIPEVHEVKVIAKNVDGIITTETQWLKDGEYKTGAVPVYTNSYSSEGEANSFTPCRASILARLSVFTSIFS